MKHKKLRKICVFNWMIVCLAVLTFVQALYSVAAAMFTTKKMDTTDLNISAYNETKFTKSGLLDLLDNDISYEPTKPIQLNSKEDVIEAYNNYISGNFNSGLVSAVGYTFVTGTGTLNGFEGTYCYVVEENMSMQNGVYVNYNYCAEVPNANGDIGNFSTNYVSYETLENGVYTINKIEGHDEITTYNKDGNNRYNVVIKNKNYNKTKTYQKPEQNLFGYVLNVNTIDSCKIDNDSNFVVKVNLTFNDEGLRIYQTDIKEFTGSSKDVNFNKFEVEILFNKYTGEIIQINRSEAYVVQQAISVQINRNAVYFSKKQDN